MLNDIVGPSWAAQLQEVFDSEEMKKLSAWISHCRQSMTVYPDKEDTFRALRLCPFNKTKVIILGQEPYYQGNADGLAFSYKNGLRMGQGMQALDVILDEIENDCYDGFNVNKEYQLDYLAKQGVLLLNVVLTVFRNKVGSHKGIGWEYLTGSIIARLYADINPKVFLLWGKDAQAVFNDVKRTVEEKYPYASQHHLVLRAYHPAYDLHKRDTLGRLTLKYPDGFSGCGHFSAANKFLLANQIMAIDWFVGEGIPVLSDTPPF